MAQSTYGTFEQRSIARNWICNLGLVFLHPERALLWRSRSNDGVVERDVTDQICVYKEADGTRRLYTVMEYKSSHKLPVFNLKAGLLQADSGSMNVLEDVVNRITIPTDPEGSLCTTPSD